MTQLAEEHTQSIVLIPTYNERENVERMIHTVMALRPQFDVLIIDDNSPDGTADIVRSLLDQYPRLHLLSRAGKQGLGTAYIAGFRWALEHDYRYIIEMDCDFSHPTDKLIELRNACASGRMDVAVGSRYIRGGQVVNWPLDRIAMSYGASLYVRLITWLPIADTTAGFVCYRREVLEAMVLDDIRLRGYGFQIEMKYTAHTLGFKVGEVPITFTDRTHGQSKMSSSIFGEAFMGVLHLRKRKLLGQFPLRK